MVKKSVTMGLKEDPTIASGWKHHVGDHVRGMVWDTVLWRWCLETDSTVQHSKQ